MPVWFASRDFDAGLPTGKHLRRFDEDTTVLAWFQRHWEHLAIKDREESDRRLADVVGCDALHLWNPFWRAVDAGLPAPRSAEALAALLRHEGDEVVADSPHDCSILAGSEEWALYWFDGHFLDKPGHRAAYLLHEGWRLPSGSGAGGFSPGVETDLAGTRGDGPGATYAIRLDLERGQTLEDRLPAWRFDGVRLPGLARRLLAEPLGIDSSAVWLRLLAALLFTGVALPDPMEQAFLSSIRADPGDGASWAAWDDWRQERGAEPPGVTLLRDAFARMTRFSGPIQDRLTPENLLEYETVHKIHLRTEIRSLIHVEPHLAQMCLDVTHGDDAIFRQWILFDDLWASAHPALANALLRWCARWDVLSEG